MRIIAALLAVPVIAATYLPRRFRRPVVARLLLLVVVPVALVGVVATRGAAEPEQVAGAVAGVTSTPEPEWSAFPTLVAPAPSVGLTSDPIVDPTSADLTGGWLRSFARTTWTAEGFAIIPATPTPTPDPPRVVRFRPRPGTTGVSPSAEVSVRFTTAMDEAATAAAFRVTVNGTVVTGKTRWAEESTVLVLRPAARFPASAKVTLSVGTDARSAAGLALVKAASATFTVAKPAPKPTAVAIPRTGSTLLDVERYALKLTNCTRTGGWVQRDGSCIGYGTRNVAPLKLDAGISDRVARPYAKYLATRGICSHFADGNPGDRLRRAGYTSYIWGENIGCRSISPYAAVLASHLYFQSEKSYLGGHYVTIMNANYDRVGMGVVVVNGTLRWVSVFYHP